VLFYNSIDISPLKKSFIESSERAKWRHVVNPIYFKALEIAKDLAASPNSINRVAEATSGDAARWAFLQWSLRKRARSKFELADQMLFDRDGFEMATHEDVARYHASQFPSGEMVFDLTAGIGADLIALASRGPAQGFELDRERAELARHNLAAHGLATGVELLSAFDAEAPDYWFADPARRTSGRRTLDPSQFSPNPVDLIEKYKNAKLGVLKVSPMLPDDFLESLGGRLEFVSFGGECREALVFVGREAGFGRSAVHIESGESLMASDGPLPTQPEPGTFLFEADPAAIRGHCLSTIADDLDLVGLGDSNGYLTGKALVRSPWLKGFRVLAVNKGDTQATRKTLENLESATPVWKQRGAELNLDKMFKQIRLKGKRALLVIAYRVGKSLRFVVAERE
jgi:hypothetical protein